MSLLIVHTHPYDERECYKHGKIKTGLCWKGNQFGLYCFNGCWLKWIAQSPDVLRKAPRRTGAKQ